VKTVKYDFRGHAALITGGTGGIGGAIADALAIAGADVVVQGRQWEPAVDELLVRCRSHGVRAAFVAADLFGPPEQTVDAVFHAAIHAEPGIDLLVNNAGGCARYGPFCEMTFAQ